MSARTIVSVSGLAAVLAAAVLAAPPYGPKDRPKSGDGKPQPADAKGMGAIFVSAEGLAPTSPRQYWLHAPAGRLVKVCTMGRPEAVPPGTYEVRVGFPSGWVTQTVEVRTGERRVVPTGLLAFRQITPPEQPSTVPQELCFGPTYLATGYQGTTARLLPGEYTVCYRNPEKDRPAQPFGRWHVVGPFPAPGGRGQAQPPACPVETETTRDFTRTYAAGRRKVAWEALAGEGALELESATRRPGGIVYACGTLNAAAEGAVRLVVQCRAPAKLWLNGHAVGPPALGETRRHGGPLVVLARLRRGRNELLVRTRLSWGADLLRAAAVHVKTYQVKVTADGDGAPPPPGPATASPAASQAPPALAADEPAGIVFCQILDLPDGRCGLAADQFFFPRRPRKARICSLVPATPDGRLRNLTPEFVAAIHPAISYDAQRVLFSGKKSRRESWDLWEMNVDGSGKRRLTRDMGDCLNPCYLPGGRALFCSGKGGVRDEYDKEVAKRMFVCDLPAGNADANGANATQITFNLSSDSFPTVLQDGRILFTSWQHHANHRGEAGVFVLFTCNPDGTVAMPFYGNQPGEGGAVKSFAQQLPDGRVVCVEVAGRAGFATGALATLDPANPLKRFRLISDGQIDYSGTYTGGRFTTPWPLPDGRMLCSFSPGRVASTRQTLCEDPHLGIYWFDLPTGRPGRLVFDDPSAQDLSPMAIAPRPVPPAIPSLVQPGAKTGTLLCVNPYLSDRKATKLVEIGHLPPARPGEVRAVRVLEGFGNGDRDNKRYSGFVTQVGMAGHGTSNTASSFEQKRIVGTAATEADGSFHIEVPADTTLHLQTLDANGMAIETQLTWIWVRPGERRFCVGCHEGRDTALPNLDCKAMYRQRPHFLAPPPEQRRTVDFRRDLMPIIQGKCATAKCHGARPPTGGLDLGGGNELVFHYKGKLGQRMQAAHFNRAYESLLAHTGGRSLTGRLVRPGAARHSPLIWRLYDRQLGMNDRRLNYRWPDKPRSHKAVLTKAERRLFVEWVDIGAQWDNLPGPDGLPGYDRDQSRALALAAAEAVRTTIRQPSLAFEARCGQCHGEERNCLARKRLATEADRREMVRRMDLKKPGWIRPTERPLILEEIRRRYGPRPR